jgi:hypothetical protein
VGVKSWNLGDTHCTYLHSDRLRRNFIWKIDYRCEGGRVGGTASCVAVSNLDLLSSTGTRVNAGIKSWKKHLSEWALCQKAIGGIHSTKKWRPETLQPGLEFDNLKPRLKSGIFKCISWLNGSFLGGDHQGFLKEEVKTNLMASKNQSNSHLLTRQYFSVFIFIVHEHWNQTSYRKTLFSWIKHSILLLLSAPFRLGHPWLDVQRYFAEIKVCKTVKLARTDRTVYKVNDQLPTGKRPIIQKEAVIKYWRI